MERGGLGQVEGGNAAGMAKRRHGTVDVYKALSGRIRQQAERERGSETI
jgi:hypothetical protein